MEIMRNLIGGQECCEVAQCESPSVIDNLKRRKISLEKQLTDVNNAITALEDNPKIMEVLELLGRCR